uniref:Uncharacterized protein n=1 Tax=Panagrolaimus sp. ES5 TaxID=591445 RepID=A0AC34F5B4_9BILA
MNLFILLTVFSFVITFANTAPNCLPNGTTLAPTTTTLIPTTQKPVIPFSCSATQKFAAIYSRHDVLVDGHAGYGKADFAGVCNSTRIGAMIYMDGRTPNYVTPDGVSAAGSVILAACPYICMCSSTGSCYGINPTTTPVNPETLLYPHCDSTGACYFAVIILTPGEMKPYNNNPGQIYTDVLQHDANGARLPITDPAYFRVASVACNGCPITIE